MQGQRGAIGSLSEGLAFDHGSGSSDSGVVEQEVRWGNDVQNPQTNRLSDYVLPADPNTIFLNPTNQDGRDMSPWTVGESSSSSVPHQAGPSSFEPGDLDMNLSRSHGRHGLLSSLPDCIHHNFPANPSSFVGFKPSNSSEAFRGSAGGGSSFSDAFGPSSEMEGRRLPRKRKAVELGVGPSSVIGSSNPFQRPEGSTSAWHPVADTVPSDPTIPRLGLGVGGANSSENPVENAHRNVRLRISTSGREIPSSANDNHRQLNLLSPYPYPVSSRSPPAAVAENPSSHQPQPALRIPCSRRNSQASSSLNRSSVFPGDRNESGSITLPATENSSSHQGQPPVLRIPALRRNLQASSRLNRNSGSRGNRSLNALLSGDRNEPGSMTLPTSVLDHPLFVPPNETRNDVNWSGNGSGGNGVASSSRAGPSVGPALSSAAAHRSTPHYPPRLSEFLRRSLLSANDSVAAGGPRIAPSVGAAASSQDPPVVRVHGGHHHLPHSRSLASLDGAFGFPHVSRTMAAGSEGRGRLVSEIRNVLELMRRGEALRFEDLMILDQSVFYGVADVHDRHRDMRLDIDNMSYEELLALEERIGDVNTGLTEETILKRLKQSKYSSLTSQPDAEPCCICQEEYNNGDDTGALDCGHDFHTGCIKQWLVQKNVCPVCKSTAFAPK